MVIYDPTEILVEFLRTRITDPRGRHTANSDTFSGDGSTKTFTLTPTSGKRVQYISSVTVDGSTKDKWQDYYIDLQNQQIIFKSAPQSGTNNIIINYYEGSSSWIYPDMPRIDLSSSSYPRISVLIVSSPGERLGRYDASVEYNIHFQIDVWTKRNEGSIDTQIFTIEGRKYEGDKLAYILGNQICQALKRYENDMFPMLYDYQPISGPRAMPYDKEHNAFHSVVEFMLKSIDIGESL